MVSFIESTMRESLDRALLAIAAEDQVAAQSHACVSQALTSLAVAAVPVPGRGNAVRAGHDLITTIETWRHEIDILAHLDHDEEPGTVSPPGLIKKNK